MMISQINSRMNRSIIITNIKDTTLAKAKAGSPASKAKKGKSPKAKVAKPKKEKRELIPVNEDSSSWKVDLDVNTAKDGRVKYPITGEGRFPLLNNARADNGHGKKQNFLAFKIDKFTPVKGDKDDYAIRVNRREDLRASQADAMLTGLRKIMKAAAKKVNDAVSEKEKAQNAAIRKEEREKKAKAKVKTGSPKSTTNKSPKAKSPKTKSPKKK